MTQYTVVSSWWQQIDFRSCQMLCMAKCSVPGAPNVADNVSRYRAYPPPHVLDWHLILVAERDPIHFNPFGLVAAYEETLSGSPIRIAAADFAILEVRPLSHGQQIRLGCGAAINIYSNGTVQVQGRFIESVRDESWGILKKILPTTTKWHVS